MNRLREKYPGYCVVILIIILLWSAVNPYDKMVWIIDTLFIIILVMILAFTHAKYPLSNFTYTLITIYFIILTIGSHYSYTQVPYLEWLRNYLGLSTRNYNNIVNSSYGLLGTARNNYDRIVHFSFGFLITFPLREILDRYVNIRGTWKYLVAFLIIGCLSALYEIFEWSLGIIINPTQAATYVASQGDVWDSQKDMAMALLGSIFSLIFS
jgi:putative membrane protein